MIAPHEASLAHRAGKLLLAGVGPLVARQLIAAREAPPAVLVGAGKGPLARVGAPVGLKMRGFEVILAAARMIALEDPTARGIFVQLPGIFGVGRPKEEETLRWAQNHG